LTGCFRHFRLYAAVDAGVSDNRALSLIACVTIPKKRLQSSVFRFKQFVAEAPGAAMSEAIPLARLQSIVNLELGSHRE